MIHADGTNVNDLKEAEIEEADILAAVTGHDQNNLVACQLTKNYFKIPRTLEPLGERDLSSSATASTQGSP